jgi:hypothetical protein
VITVVNGSSSQSRGVAARLTNEFGQGIGVIKQPIQCAQVYQLVIAFVILTSAGARRLVVVTTNEGNTAAPSAVRFDTDSPYFAAIDTFTIY